MGTYHSFRTFNEFMTHVDAAYVPRGFCTLYIIHTTASESGNLSDHTEKLPGVIRLYLLISLQRVTNG